jgi:metal-dependent amidase/aminoacylase/carboxypeptidase family protein
MDTKEFRRQMHRCPELSFKEHQTYRFISDSLSELGIEF